MQYGEHRVHTARVDPTFRPSDVDSASTFACYTDGRWMSPTKSVELKRSFAATAAAKLAVPKDTRALGAKSGGCGAAVAIMKATVPLPAVDAALAARRSPLALQWTRKVGETKISAREDPPQAAAYEQALKRRPAPFVVQWRKQGEGASRAKSPSKVYKGKGKAGEEAVGDLIIAGNPATLVHRALANVSGGRVVDVSLAYSLDLRDAYLRFTRVFHGKTLVVRVVKRVMRRRTQLLVGE